MQMNQDGNAHNIKPYRISAGTLAFLGDAVYELHVRNDIVKRLDTTAGKLHKTAVRFVCAKAQAYAVERIMNQFDEKEMQIYKRGRNACTQTVPKNCTVMQYRRATGLEAVIGYLVLLGDKTRAEQLMDRCLAVIRGQGEPS